MNYKKIYDSLIQKAKNRKLLPSEYYEKHHIIPKSLGGLDNDDNLIFLTYKEHYLAHLLLYKLYSNQKEKYKMGCAIFMMSKGNNNFRINNSRMYEKSKKIFKMEYKNFLLTNEGKKYLKNRAKTRVNNQQINFIYHFYHKEYGDFNISTKQLMEIFSEQKLNSSNLVKVGKKERFYHKGWCLYENKDYADKFNIEKRRKMSESAKKKFKNDDMKKMYKEFRILGAKSQKGQIMHYHKNGKKYKAHLGSKKSNMLINQGFFIKKEINDNKFI
ncbi:MAG: HNH endonuclease signature motif containing protein [Candidatus Woesearchaeota archaeon]